MRQNSCARAHAGRSSAVILNAALAKGKPTHCAAVQLCKICCTAVANLYVKKLIYQLTRPIAISAATVERAQKEVRRTALIGKSGCVEVATNIRTFQQGRNRPRSSLYAPHTQQEQEVVCKFHLPHDSLEAQATAQNSTFLDSTSQKPVFQISYYNTRNSALSLNVNNSDL